MARSTSKWAIALLVLIALLLFLYLIGRKSVHTELVIDASPQEIWDVLMDEEGYTTWNQVLVPISGTIEPGNSLTYNLIDPAGEILELQFKVVALNPLKLLNQKGGIPGIFTFDHRYILEPIGTKTKLIIHEDFRGIAAPFLDVGWVEEAYTELTRSLRGHVLETDQD